MPESLRLLVRSVGPGPRMEHLRRLIRDHHDPRHELVIADDDVTFKRGNGVEFLELCRLGCFDLAQPGHALGSEKSFEFNRAAVLSRARLTTFVEVGPLVWMSQSAQEQLLPLDIGAGMGWGVDVLWRHKSAGLLRLGVIDGAAIVHHGSVAADYATKSEHNYLDEMLALVDATDVSELAQTIGRPWRSWRRTPPWS